MFLMRVMTETMTMIRRISLKRYSRVFLEAKLLIINNLLPPLILTLSLNQMMIVKVAKTNLMKMMARAKKMRTGMNK